MAEIHRLIDAPRVVKDGEQLDDVRVGAGREGRDTAAVLEDARPMADAMRAAGRQSIVLQDAGEEGRSEEGHGRDKAEGGRMKDEKEDGKRNEERRKKKLESGKYDRAKGD